MTWLTTRANPWGLTDAEARTLAAIVEVGANKLAARRLSVDPSTVDQHLSAARKKIGAATRLQAVIEWDRMTRTPDQIPTVRLEDVWRQA